MRSDRAVAFQSTYRKSSPGEYSRCCENSTDKPARGCRWRPGNSVSAIARERSSRCCNLARVPGSKERAEVICGSSGDDRNRSNHFVQQVSGNDPIRLSRKIRANAMSQHRRSDPRHVGRGRLWSTLQRRRSLGGKHQMATGPRPGTPANIPPHLIRRLGRIRASRPRNSHRIVGNDRGHRQAPQ